MVPSWVTVLTSLGAGAVVGSLLTSLVQLWITKQSHKNQLERERIAFEREQIKEQSANERVESEKRKERIRQSAAGIYRSLRTVRSALSDAAVIQASTASKIDIRIREHERLAKILRDALDILDANEVLFKFDLPKEESLPTLLHGRIFQLVLFLERGEKGGDGAIDWNENPFVKGVRQELQDFLDKFPGRISRLLDESSLASS